MPAVQTSYPTTLAAGRPGQAQSMVNWNAITRLCETAAGIGFGLAVTRGTGQKGAKLGGASADIFLGCTLEDKTLIVPSGGTVDKYPQYANMAVCNVGAVFVKPQTAVVAGDDVYFDATTGEFTNDDTDVGPVPGAKWETSAGAGGIAVISLGIPRTPAA